MYIWKNHLKGKIFHFLDEQPFKRCCLHMQKMSEEGCRIAILIGEQQYYCVQ